MIDLLRYYLLDWRQRRIAADLESLGARLREDMDGYKALHRRMRKIRQQRDSLRARVSFTPERIPGIGNY